MSFKKNVMRKNKIHLYTGLAFLLLIGGCGKYLDVVPDNIVEVSKYYENRQKAYTGLATCYSYMPKLDHIDQSMVLAGDEFCGRVDPTYEQDKKLLRGIKIMLKERSASLPIISYWDGKGNPKNADYNITDLYDGIRNCNIFLENIDLVPNMVDKDKNDWRAQVIFLKAYYHFYLLQHYGPIVIADGYVKASSSIEDVRQSRSSIDNCFAYIDSIIDVAIPNLPIDRGLNDAGMIDRVGALAMKARVLLYAASPFYNGNNEYYANFKDQSGVHYFNQSYDAKKWELALNAAKEAIAQAENFAGKKIFEYSKSVYSFDIADSDSSEIMKYVYNNRFSVNEPWNEELLWGYSNQSMDGEQHFSHFCNMRSLLEPTLTDGGQQWLGANYAMMELFYSKNGVPIEEDLTYTYDNRLDIVTIPADNYTRGFLQEGEQTINLHLNREPRFYAWMGIDRGYWRTHSVRNELNMRYGQNPGGKTAQTTWGFYPSGIAIKKLVHPESGTGNIDRTKKYPWPVIRLADLYLMIAEASNELYGPSQEVYDALNKIRSRAGLPNIEVVWSNPAIVKDVDKHKDQFGLRQIIQQERLIEFCFEGHRYYDLIRWKRAEEFFQLPIQGWDVIKSRTDFYTLGIVQAREWQSPRDNLFPIPLEELTVNPNLIQNPGW
jgi:hypothetical protein